MTTPHRTDSIVVVGGGLAGLIAATKAALSGLPVTLLEKASAPGGRAATQLRNGILLNLGPHALYRSGTLAQTLKTLGVAVTGRIPGGSGGYALYRNSLHTLPIGVA